MLHRLRQRFKYRTFYRETSRILATPPIPYREAPFTIVSMVAGYDVQMYILAVKALYQRLQRGKITVIADGISVEGRDLIHRHLGPVRFIKHVDIDTGSCPRGGTWGRLVHIVRNTVDEYTLEMDADVLCVGPIAEVLECIDRNRAFTLSDSEGIPKQPLPASAGERRVSRHVVIVFEKRAPRFDGLPAIQSRVDWDPARNAKWEALCREQ